VSSCATTAFTPMITPDRRRSTLPLTRDLRTCPTCHGADLVRVAFPAFSDGRGFTLARHLRAVGYTGRLRAKGHVIADQYAMARRVGFDEVEIPDDLAQRQPAEQWIFRADWREHDYRSRVRA
jgi:uncharacterized protein (DUF934 family)